MPKSSRYVPTHRAPGKHKAVGVRRRALRTGVAMTGLAAAVTGVSVAGGLLSDDSALTPAAADVATTTQASPESSPQDASTPSAAALEQRARRTVTSRSARRTDAAKATALSMSAGSAVTRSEKPYAGQFSCLDSLYMSESGWRIDADNPTSSAYGIPQALTELHDLPADYMTSAESQIRWGLEYIQDAYGTPCSAWSFKSGHGWY